MKPVLMDSPKDFGVSVNLPWFKASKFYEADWMRHCVAEITGLIQVPHDAGSLRVLPATRSLWALGKQLDAVSVHKQKEGGRKATPLEIKLAFRGSCRHWIHQFLVSFTLLLSPRSLHLCGTSSHPLLSRCWANHLHLSLALLRVTHWSTGWGITSLIPLRVQIRLLPLPMTLGSPWPSHPFLCIVIIH